MFYVLIVFYVIVDDGPTVVVAGQFLGWGWMRVFRPPLNQKTYPLWGWGKPRGFYWEREERQEAGHLSRERIITERQLLLPYVYLLVLFIGTNVLFRRQEMDLSLSGDRT